MKIFAVAAVLELDVVLVVAAAELAGAIGIGMLADTECVVVSEN